MEKECYMNPRIIHGLNNDHIDALTSYVSLHAGFDNLKKNNPDYDFESVIDFVDMERQKLKLNKVINDFNFRLLSDSRIKLWTVDECMTEAKEIIARVE